MGYTKTWTPPTIPYRDNLPVWKTICNDIHTNLILAGLVQTEDTGQLDIDAVMTLPADGTFAGYRVYSFNDALQATMPIFIKLSFGCGVEGNTSSSTSYCRSRTIRIKVQIGKVTDGAGTIGALAHDTIYQCPQSFSPTGSVTSQLTHAGESFACRNDEMGFFGFMYGVGSRNKPYAHSGFGAYYGCTLAILIQRDTDVNGTPIDSGFSFYQPHESGDWSNQNWGAISYSYPIVSRYISRTTTAMTSVTTAAQRPVATQGDPIAGVPQVHPVYMITPQVKRLQTLVSYRTTDVPTGTVFQLEINPGVIRNFVALGNENALYVCNQTGYTASFAMLYE